MKKKHLQSVYGVSNWLSIHISHLSYVRNLILTFGVASIGFALSKYPDIIVGANKVVKYCIVSSIIFFAISVAIGVLIAILQDKIYRLYRHISRIIECTDEDPDQNIDPLIFKNINILCTKLENYNKWLFTFQGVFFCFGVMNLSISIL
jgi:hypothetical protein